MKQLLFLLLFIVFTCQVFSQHEDQKWIYNWSNIDSCDLYSQFPEICGASVLDFETLPPQHYRHKKITLDFKTTHASLCDESGELMLYCNGQSVHGADHKPIINGDIINYSPKWDWLTFTNELGEVKPSGFKYSQAVGFFNVPDSEDKYISLYHNYEYSEEDRYELWFSELTKNEFNEFEIVVKDSLINDKIRVPGNLHSCSHANGRDQWILQFSNDTVYTYLIDPEGLKLDRLQFLPFKLRDSNGQSKFSKTGNKFALHGAVESQTSNGTDFMIADFDRCSGEILSPEYWQINSIDGSSLNSGLEFSEDGNLLYLSHGFYLYQYDLLASDIIQSRITVSEINHICDDWGTINAFGQMQLAADNKIYISVATQCFHVHRIDFPNIRGTECNVVQNAIILDSYHLGTIPNFNTLRLGPLDGSSCDTLGLDNHPISRFWYEQDSMDHKKIQFRDVSYFRPETWSWTFGDGNGSSDKSPIHNYSENGVYEVCLTVSNENSSNTSCQELQIGPVSNDNVSRTYDVSIFPNPVEDFTRLVFHDYLPEAAWIKVYDVKSEVVYSTRVYQESMVDLSLLSAGVYFYEVIDGGVVLSGGKLVKS